MIRNTFVEGLNSRARLPSAVVIMCGEEFIAKDPLFLPSEFERKIKWVLKEIDAAIKSRKSILPVKTFTFGEPRIIWVKAFQNSVNNNLKDEHLNKFNNLLKKQAIPRGVYTIDLAVFADTTIRCFDKDGVSQFKTGFHEMWLAIANELKIIDEDDVQYETDRKVEKRLKELQRQHEKRFERQSHTYVNV